MLKCFTLNGKNALTILIKYPYILTSYNFSVLAILSATVKAQKPTVTELLFLVLLLLLFFSVDC